MELVRLVIDGFPYLNEEEYIRVLKQKIKDETGAYPEGRRNRRRHHAVFL